MLKRAFTIFAAVAVFASVSFAQSGAVKDVKKVQLQNEHYQAPQVVTDNVLPSVFPVNTPAVGDTIGTTNYDYFTNSVVRNQVFFNPADGKVHFANMLRQPGSKRVIHYIYPDGAVYAKMVPFDSVAAASGWPDISVKNVGSDLGTVAIVGHTPSKLGISDGASPFLVTGFNPSTDPSVAWGGENIFLAASGNRTQFQFYKSEDLGSTFTNWDSISSYHPTPIWWVENGGVEVGIATSPDNNYIAYYGTNAGQAGGGAHVYNPVSADSADNFWAIYSTNGGTSFTGMRIAADGVIGLVANRPGYAPLFENFGHVDMAVANDGVWHAVANGYGLTFDGTGTATGNMFPLIYWNSTTNAWTAISDIKIDTIQAISDLYPTNSIGQAYPSVSVSPDGKVVYAIWTGPEFTGDPSAATLDTAEAVYWRDLYHAYSTNGGANWTYGGVLQGKNSKSEAFGHAAQWLEDAGDKYVAHIVYLEDQSPTVSLFAGVGTQDPIVYKTFDLPKPTVSVEDGTTPFGFTLNQNYPNPFNPSTQITFNLAQAGNVSLKVFDVLGREVATLVNSELASGAHTVTFDASDLASGLYVYRLDAGNMTATRKMMLMK